MIKNRLQKILSDIGMSQRDLAEKIKTDKAVINRIAQNKAQRYDSSVLDRICKYLGIQPGDLLYYTEEEEDK